VADDSERRDDMLLVCGRAQDGDGYTVVRRRQDAVEAGELRTLERGKPIVGEVVRLSQRPEHQLLFDVEVLADARPAARSGPAQVATRAYRENWENVFGGNDDPEDHDHHDHQEHQNHAMDGETGDLN
jgi:hypothetical protein